MSKWSGTNKMLRKCTLFVRASCKSSTMRKMPLNRVRLSCTCQSTRTSAITKFCTSWSQTWSSGLSQRITLWRKVKMLSTSCRTFSSCAWARTHWMSFVTCSRRPLTISSGSPWSGGTASWSRRTATQSAIRRRRRRRTKPWATTLPVLPKTCLASKCLSSKMMIQKATKHSKRTRSQKTQKVPRKTWKRTCKSYKKGCRHSMRP